MDEPTNDPTKSGAAHSSQRSRRLTRGLVAAAIGVILGACGSSAAPSPTNSVMQGTPDPSVAADPQVLELSVTDFTFSTDRLEAEAGRRISISFTNFDSVVHNFQIWRDDARDDKLFFGDLIRGPATVLYELGELEPGTYRFECHPHAGTMIGHLVVEPAP